MILFNSKEGIVEFSNFHGAFWLDGRLYPCPEVFFQSRKTLSLKERERVLAAGSGGEARREGRRVSIRPDWPEIRVEVLRQAVRAKFLQNDRLRRLLLETGDEELAEHAPWDKGESFWGWPGRNMTGRILQDVRSELSHTHPKRVIVAGSRSITSRWWIFLVLDGLRERIPVSEIVSGGARGVDRLGEEYAAARRIPLKRFPAQWERFGKKAGYLRNEEMARNADVLVAFWDGQSRGTGHMIETARREGLEVHVHLQPRVWTARVGEYQGADALDITVKSGEKAFAPTWGMVMGLKKGRLSRDEYTREYHDLMVRSFRAFPGRWRDLMTREEVTLLCYCKKGDFCHRLLLADYLTKLGARYMGER